MKRKKLNTCIALLLALFLISSNIVFAKNPIDYHDNTRNKEDSFIDQDTALSIGLLFVSALTKEQSWNESTQIEYVRPLYSYDNTINNYYIALVTEENKPSYVIVSANKEKPLITEFSDNSEITVKIAEDNLELFFISDIPEEERVYYDSLICATYPVRVSEAELEKFNSVDTYKTVADYLINFIRENNISLMQRSCGYGFISNPVTYLQNLHPDSFIYSGTEHAASGSYQDYYIGLNNGCVVYATTCILTRYLNGTKTFYEVLLTCKNVAETQNFAHMSGGEWNYYIQIGSTAQYVTECIFALGLSKSSMSSLFYSQARNELNNQRACILNIGYYNSTNIDHAVVAYSWIPYYITTGENNITQINFYKVLDGDINCFYQGTTRYACEDAITGFFVTKIY